MQSIRSLGMIKGLSLIEILVTITITSIGLMGLVSLQMQAVRATTDSGNRSQAVWIFNDIISRIHANEVASFSYVTPASYIIAAGQNSPPVCAAVIAPVCSRYHTGTGLPIPAADCTSTQQAAWDLYEVACGTPKAQGFQGNSINYLPQAQLTISCATAGCGNGDPLNITLQWRARTDDEATTGVARTANSGLLTLTDVITP
ncbi:MAG: type IV pilus assembly protein PilV [Oleispira sp.]|jgi:type IV pilus assembly protein PilV